MIAKEITMKEYFLSYYSIIPEFDKIMQILLKVFVEIQQKIEIVKKVIKKV